MRFMVCKHCGDNTVVVGKDHLCEEMRKNNIASQRVSYDNREHFATLKEASESNDWMINSEETDDIPSKRSMKPVSQT